MSAVIRSLDARVRLLTLQQQFGLTISAAGALIALGEMAHRMATA
ncbi:MAG: hypothetical protein QG612_38 [Pseudomonadota bacterium]|nr:hypothetical protein [Pseudomonadota bacterium]